jgi:hypothetical protein
MVIGLLAGIIGLCLLIGDLPAQVPWCDEEEPKVATGACSAGTTCEGQDNVTDCNAASASALEIMEDFPTGCKAAEAMPNNCIGILEACKPTVDCEWKAGCDVKPGTEGPWQSTNRWTIWSCI